MICGTGIDLMNIDKMEKAIARSGDRFINKVFTPEEISYCAQRARDGQHFATRFAAKEAALKALGTGWRSGIKWTDIEVKNDALGKPELRFYGKAQELLVEMGVKNVFLSLSHCSGFAIAQVIFEK